MPSVFSDAAVDRRTMKRTKSSLLAFKLREVGARARARAPRHHLHGVHAQTALLVPHCLLTCICFLPRSQFLDTRDMPVPEPMHFATHEPSRPRVENRPANSTPKPSAVDQVWVDCFYYGFYMDKSKLPAFQASLRQNPAFQQHQQRQAAAAT